MPEILSKSPINTPALSSENLSIYNLLIDGRKLTKFNVIAGSPHSRFFEVRKWLADRNIILQDEYVIRKNGANKDVQVKLYWLNHDDILRLKNGVDIVEKSWISEKELLDLKFTKEKYSYNLGLKDVIIACGYTGDKIYPMYLHVESNIIALNISSAKELKNFIKYLS